jgi:hypothetical protein
MPNIINIEFSFINVPPIEMELNYAANPPVLIELSQPSEAIQVEFSNIGTKGDDGKSTYQIWLDQGNAGTEQDFLDSLKSNLAGSKVHDQATASAIWTINHALGYFPNVTAVDSTGREVVGDVQYTSINTLNILFTAAFAGSAYLS